MAKVVGRKIELDGKGKVSVTSAGLLVVDRRSLHASGSYLDQVNALQKIVRTSLGKAPESSGAKKSIQK